MKRNGYSIQYIHNGNYLLLQGCSADSCFPQIEGFAGAKIVLSNIFKMDLLSEDDKAWQTTTLGQMRKCARSVYIDTLSEYSDRAGAIMAIRWSASYDGRYDDRIVSGVNLFRYVLASFAEDDTPLVQTAVPDDVFIRDGNRILKVIDDGKPLDTPGGIRQHVTASRGKTCPH